MEHPTNDTRKRILDAAISVFSQKGYHEARVDEIVQASHTSKGAVYFHFPSKQDIFLGLIDEFASLLKSNLNRAIASQRGGVNKVNAALNVCLETFSKYRKLAKIFLVQAVGLGSVFEEKQRAIHAEFVQLVKGHLEEAIADGDIPPIDAEVAARAWVGAINEVVIEWIYNDQPSPQRALPALRTILLRSIGVPEAEIQRLDEAR